MGVSLDALEPMKGVTTVVALVALLALGCDSRKREILADAKAHSASLVNAARSLASAPIGPVEKSDYPAEIRRLNPAMVTRIDRGVMIYVYSSPIHVTGIFVRQDPTFTPPPPKPDSDEFGYEPIAADLYWFSRPR